MNISKSLKITEKRNLELAKLCMAELSKEVKRGGDLGSLLKNIEPIVKNKTEALFVGFMVSSVIDGIKQEMIEHIKGHLHDHADHGHEMESLRKASNLIN